MMLGCAATLTDSPTKSAVGSEGTRSKADLGLMLDQSPINPIHYKRSVRNIRQALLRADLPSGEQRSWVVGATSRWRLAPSGALYEYIEDPGDIAASQARVITHGWQATEPRVVSIDLGSLSASRRPTRMLLNEPLGVASVTLAPVAPLEGVDQVTITIDLQGGAVLSSYANHARSQENEAHGEETITFVDLVPVHDKSLSLARFFYRSTEQSERSEGCVFVIAWGNQFADPLWSLRIASGNAATPYGQPVHSVSSPVLKHGLLAHGSWFRIWDPNLAAYRSFSLHDYGDGSIEVVEND
jgi:hypothetical protein